MVTKRAKRSRSVKGLPAKGLTARQSTNIKGGALSAYLSLKGQKQGDTKGSTTK